VILIFNESKGWDGNTPACSKVLVRRSPRERYETLQQFQPREPALLSQHIQELFAVCLHIQLFAYKALADSLELRD
jgi:hypothetical protein